LATAWQETLAGRRSPESFVRESRATGQPVVAEYGLWASPPAIALLRQLRAQGAVSLWFDSEPMDAARLAWLDRNERAGEQRRENRQVPVMYFEGGDRKWREVVAAIRVYRSQLLAFFGPSRTIVTVTATPEGGYQHTPSSTIYDWMRGAVATAPE
jgi:hypothetical protein